jgi:hypothetical protein
MRGLRPALRRLGVLSRFPGARKPDQFDDAITIHSRRHSRSQKGLRGAKAVQPDMASGPGRERVYCRQRKVFCLNGVRRVRLRFHR